MAARSEIEIGIEFVFAIAAAVAADIAIAAGISDKRIAAAIVDKIVLQVVDTDLNFAGNYNRCNRSARHRSLNFFLKEN